MGTDATNCQAGRLCFHFNKAIIFINTASLIQNKELELAKPENIVHAFVLKKNITAILPPALPTGPVLEIILLKYWTIPANCKFLLPISSPTGPTLFPSTFACCFSRTETSKGAARQIFLHIAQIEELLITLLCLEGLKLFKKNPLHFEAPRFPVALNLQAFYDKATCSATPAQSRDRHGLNLFDCGKAWQLLGFIATCKNGQ